MADLQLVDVSIRDGNQSLWGATGLRTGQILQIAPVLDRAGFRALDFTSSTHMGVAVRTHRENPWERIRLTHAATPHTPLQFIGTGFRFISWQTAHPEVMQLIYDRLVACGISRFIVLDPMHDMAAVRRTAAMIAAAGGQEIVGALTYTVSEVHDDPFYAGLAGEMAACPDITRVYVKDPAGLLTPERARTLIPAVRPSSPWFLQQSSCQRTRSATASEDSSPSCRHSRDSSRPSASSTWISTWTQVSPCAARLVCIRSARALAANTTGSACSAGGSNPT